MSIIDTIRSQFLFAPQDSPHYTENFPTSRTEFVPTLSPVVNAIVQRGMVRFSYDQVESPYFDHEQDEIVMLDPDAFPTAEAYTHALAHELVHWSGHHSRINRTEGLPGFDGYGIQQEEAVADLGAALLLDEAGALAPELGSVASYLRVMTKDVPERTPNGIDPFMAELFGLPIRHRHPEEVFDKAAQQAYDAVTYLKGLVA